MKTGIRILLGIILFSSFACGQTSTWNQDYDKAMAEAKANGKVLLVDFSGSDWCPWCIKLDKEVFRQKAFKSYAKDALVLFLADFPRKKSLPEKTTKQNQQLAEKFGIQGFPTVVLLNAKGETIGQTGYLEGGADVYVKHIKELIAAAGKTTVRP